MSHARQQIREALATQLSSAGISNVTQSRVRTFQTLPSVNVLSTSESIAPEISTAGMVQARELEISVEVRAKGTSNVDDSLDGIAVDIEVAIMADPTLGGLAHYAELLATEVEFDDEAEKPTGLLAMTWQVTYMVNASNPEVALT